MLSVWLPPIERPAMARFSRPVFTRYCFSMYGLSARLKSCVKSSVALSGALIGAGGAPILPTADWGYLRLRRCDYDDAGLAAWAERIRAQPWKKAYVFFKHEDDRPLGWPAIERFLASVR